MTDATTKQPIQVFTDGGAGPYIMLPFSQLEELRHVLDAHKVPYTVDEEVISINDEPETAADGN